jgi:Arc/MetJ-type ribon-helix-helix transcriptional regulator
MSDETPGITSDGGMPRLCVRMPRSQRKELEKLVENGTFPNLSEAIRYAIRKQISN